MKRKNIDLALHPIRMRILLALSQEPATPQQIAESLADVPQASLYRHIQKLAKAGLIKVVEERQVRGAVEKVYAVEAQAAQLTAEEFKQLDREDHLRFFMAFTTSLVDDFHRYLSQTETLDALKDGIGYSKIVLELSDEELRELAEKMNAAILPLLNNPPGPERKRRLLATIMMPDARPTRSNGGSPETANP